MAAIIIGRKSDYPKRQKQGVRWFFRAGYYELPDTNEVAIVETCLMRNDAKMAAVQINEFNKQRGVADVIDEHYFDEP